MRFGNGLDHRDIPTEDYSLEKGIGVFYNGFGEEFEKIEFTNTSLPHTSNKHPLLSPRFPVALNHGYTRHSENKVTCP